MLSEVHGSVDGFGFGVIATARFTDKGYFVTVHSIRLSDVAFNAWHASEALGAPLLHTSQRAWEAYEAEKERLRREWENRMAELIGYVSSEDSSFYVTHNVGNIFTIVIMER